MKPLFFASPPELRKWFQQFHDQAEELWVGFYRVGSGRPSVTWPEAVDEALCFGWIDGVRKSIDAASYKIRFTPRKPRGIWSIVNTVRAKELVELGLMHSAGLRAFQERDPERSGVYSYERKSFRKLPDVYERKLRMNEKAWRFFRAQPPSYQRIAGYWVTSAKREETKLKRLDTLIRDSEKGRTIRPLTRPSPEKSKS
jgi:uncharacterized protein YdeI (YjbR/CyaY-like superfamily)